MTQVNMSMRSANTKMINYERVYREMVDFLKEETKCVDGVILGLGGGIDSALVAYIAVDALGKERVKTQGLPYGEQSTRDRDKKQKFLEPNTLI